MIIKKDVLRTIITDPGGAEVLVREAERLGKEFAQRPSKKRLSTSQIRALFGEVRQIEAQWHMGEERRRKAERRLILLKPKMAYRAQKERNQSVQELVDVLTPAIDIVMEEPDEKKRQENFGRFVEFFKAIPEYHKAHGGD